jgi:serine/threonine protein kinase
MIDQREVDSLIAFQNTCENVIQIYQSLHIEDREKDLNHWVIISEFADGGTLGEFFKLKTKKNAANKTPVENPLSESQLINYFTQLRFYIC